MHLYRCVVLIAGRHEALGTLPDGVLSYVLPPRVGYSAGLIEVDPTTIPVDSSLTELAEHAVRVLRGWELAALTELLEAPTWFPVGITATGSDFRTVSWDGAYVGGGAEFCERSLATLSDSLLQSRVLRSLSTAAIAAYSAGQLHRAMDYRKDIEEALLVVDPRVGVYWQADYEFIDQIRATWRIAETEDLALKAVRSLEYLASVRRQGRQELLLLIVGLVGGLAAVPAVFEFAVQDSSLAPHHSLRVAAAGVLVASAFGAIVWLRGRRP